MCYTVFTGQFPYAVQFTAFAFQKINALHLEFLNSKYSFLFPQY